MRKASYKGSLRSLDFFGVLEKKNPEAPKGTPMLG
jgi:hypothetical protein